jgi:hypothetical protein
MRPAVCGLLYEAVSHALQAACLQLLRSGQPKCRSRLHHCRLHTMFCSHHASATEKHT